jgi:hypothetical protein
MSDISSVAVPQDACTPQLISSRLSQTALGGSLWHDVPEPEELEPGILLKGGVHQIFTGPGEGKTWLALWLLARNIEREQTAVFLDMENGHRIVRERLKLLGVDGSTVDEHLHYRDFPSLDMTVESKSAYERLLDWKSPDLVIFDSWIGFLAACGLDENSPTHVEEWGNSYVNPAKLRGCTVVILDHVPHDANRSRGATRKKDLVDVQWHLKKREPFDRGTVGLVHLTKEKDREAWLPQEVRFSIGDTKDGFVFKRSEGTFSEPSDRLPDSARVALLLSAEVAKRSDKIGSWRTHFRNRLPTGVKAAGSGLGNSNERDGSSRR